MSNPKTKSLESKIKIIVSNAFLYEIENEDLKNITITSVELANGGELAKIYYSYYLATDREIIINEISKITYKISMLVAQKLTIKKSPKLQFIWDESLEKISKMDKLFESIKLDTKEEEEK